MAGATAINFLGASVRNLRFRLGISQEELANRANLHRTYIAGVEGGTRNVTLKSVEKLARALEVSIPALLSPLETNSKSSPANRFVDILLVEDDPNDVEMTLHAFGEARIANPVHVVADGAAAMDFLLCTGAYAIRYGQPLPRVILLDLNLPKIGGLEVLRRIKSDPRTRGIPVVVLTSSQQSRDVAASKRLGASNYIVKPVDFQNFSRITPELSLRWALLDPAANGPRA